MKIGITTHYVYAEQPYIFLYETYVRMIEDLGHTPFIIPMVKDFKVLQDILSTLDVVLLSGGGPGIDPSLYSGPLRSHNPRRYDFQKSVVQVCFKKGIPMMGICRGFQLISEVLGGELNLKIDTDINHLQDVKSNEVSHEINIEKNSILFDALGVDKLLVNSTHRQAVSRVPFGFEVIARADDGVIEAYYSKENKIFATQFHPEKLYSSDSKYLKVFGCFLDSLK